MIFTEVIVLITTFTACSDAGTSIYVWEDINGNGVSDKGEPPLQGVNLIIHVKLEEEDVFTPSLESCESPIYATNEMGLISTSFIASLCNQIYVYACTPDGYIPTTSITANGCSLRFGFKKESSLDISFP